jgi:hypothetical protein
MSGDKTAKSHAHAAGKKLQRAVYTRVLCVRFSVRDALLAFLEKTKKAVRDNGRKNRECRRPLSGVLPIETGRKRKNDCQHVYHQLVYHCIPWWIMTQEKNTVRALWSFLLHLKNCQQLRALFSSFDTKGMRTNPCPVSVHFVSLVFYVHTICILAHSHIFKSGTYSHTLRDGRPFKQYRVF